MENQDEFLKRLREAFQVEASEHIGAISSSLLALKNSEGEPDKDVIQTAYRAAHSLKGAARAVDLVDIENLCHALEGIFSGIVKGEIFLRKEKLSTLFEVVDLLASLLDPENQIPSRQTGDMIKKIEGLASSSARPMQAGPLPEPAPAEAGPVPQKASFPPKTEPPKPVSRPSRPPSIASTIRVATEKLDKVLLDSENLIAAKQFARQTATELQTAIASLDDFIPWALQHKESSAGFLQTMKKSLENLVVRELTEAHHIDTMIDTLIDDSRSMLMLPCSILLESFPRMVDEMSANLGKEVDFKITGKEIELEKRILEKLKDPLIHLVRNSIDHGIETPAERAAKGKTPKGALEIRISSLDTKHVEISVSDDGRGLDYKKIKETAVARGLLSENEAKAADKDKLNSFIFHSGFSTSPIVTDLSGRGLGMAIVSQALGELEGNIKIETAQGKGTAFRLIVPFSRATFRASLLRVSGRTFAVPTSGIRKMIRIKKADVIISGNKEMVRYKNKPLALLHLGDILGLQHPAQTQAPAFMTAFVSQSGDTAAAFIFDEIEGEQEILIKPLGQILKKVRNIYGATILANGEVVPVLNTRELLESAGRSGKAGQSQAQARETDAAEGSGGPKSVLVVEDSITSRMLIKTILESAGYRVGVAVDGIDGYTALKAESYDCLVSDIEMPRMNGFELTEKVRMDPALSRLPVILVTSLESREHKEKGIEVGANAYIMKSSFAQSNLLETIRRFI